MTANMYTQKNFEDTHQTTESSDLVALTVQTSSDALGNTTLDKQIDMHPARTAVFGTNELLYLILSKVPNTANLIRVSKTWNSIVRNDIGYCIQPANARANDSMCTPVYSESTSNPIDFNPIANCISDGKRHLYDNELHEWTMLFRFDNRCPSVLHRFGDQYLTSPPVTHLSVMGVRGNHNAVATIRAKDGIRLRDVAEALDKLYRSVRVECHFMYDKPSRFRQFVFSARLVCARARVHEITERSIWMLREVPGWRVSFELNV